MSCEAPPGEAGAPEAVMSKRRKFDKTGICIKCKTTPGQLVIRHAVYCKTCFQTLLTTKFRSVFDPTLKTQGGPPRGHLKARGNLMIGFSGGLGSRVVLELVRGCYFAAAKADGNGNVNGKAKVDGSGKVDVNESGNRDGKDANGVGGAEMAMGTTKRRKEGGKMHPWKSGNVWERVVVCYVDCSGAYEGVPDRTDEVKAIAERYNDIFDFIPLKLEDAFDGEGIAVDLSREELPISPPLPSTPTPPLTLLKTYLAALPTPTSHQSTLTTLIRILLLRLARSLSCSHLLLGSTLTSLSVNLIDAVASGGGFTIGLEKGEEWDSGVGDGTVKLVRPLREVSMKECAAYLHWKGLEVVGNERAVKERVNVKGSIGSLTKDFIYGLERDYPSTVSAIVRTCNKLVSNSTGEKCAFCQRPAQPGVKEWKERISIRSFATDSATPPAETDGPTLTPHLCYACHTTLTSRSSRGTRKLESAGNNVKHVPLPGWIGENLSRREVDRATMKESIKEFLLEDA
ncbi:hypothetical protein M422DRAFT_26963 [Sphaerobolus stellatus SS14]|nr:hypothetical protein M422DRAFT_26963 [Sphaerobolus stellatus SS14]